MSGHFDKGHAVKGHTTSNLRGYLCYRGGSDPDLDNQVKRLMRGLTEFRLFPTHNSDNLVGHIQRYADNQQRGKPLGGLDEI